MSVVVDISPSEMELPLNPTSPIGTLLQQDPSNEDSNDSAMTDSSSTTEDDTATTTTITQPAEKKRRLLKEAIKLTKSTTYSTEECSDSSSSQGEEAEDNVSFPPSINTTSNFSSSTTPQAYTERELQSLQEEATRSQNKGIQFLFSLYNDFKSGKHLYARREIQTYLDTFLKLAKSTTTSSISSSSSSSSIAESQFLNEKGITFYQHGDRYYLRPTEVPIHQPNEEDMRDIYTKIHSFYQNKSILSTNCGYGWVEIEGIKSHTPISVTTMDSRPEAVLTTLVNAYWHGVQDQIRVYVSSGFNVLLNSTTTTNQDSSCTFDVCHFGVSHKASPEDDLAKLQVGSHGDNTIAMNFSHPKQLIQQAKDLRIPQILAMVPLTIPESIVHTACFGPVGTIGQLLSSQKVKMHASERLTISPEQDHTPSQAAYQDICLFALTYDPISSLMTYMESKNISDIPYDNIPGVDLVREGISRVFGETFSAQNVTICPDSKQAWRNIQVLYDGDSLVSFECVDTLLDQIKSGSSLNGQVVQVSLSTQSDIDKLPQLMSSTWNHGIIVFLDMSFPLHHPHDNKKLMLNKLQQFMTSHVLPEHVHFLWTEYPHRDNEKTLLFTNNLDFKSAFDAAVEMTWSRVSMLGQFNLLHHFAEFEMIPSAKQLQQQQQQQRSPSLDHTPQVNFRVHKSFNSNILEASRLVASRKDCIPLDYGDNRVNERGSVAKKWGIPQLQSHIQHDDIRTNEELRGIFSTFFQSRFYLESEIILVANGVSDIFNGVALYAHENKKSIAFPEPAYGEFLANAQALLDLVTYNKLSNGMDGKLTPATVETYLDKYSDGVVYWNMPYANPTGAGYSEQEISDVLTSLNKYPSATVFIDAVFLDTGEQFHERFDLSAIQIHYVVATGLSKSIGGPGFRVAGAIVSDEDLARSLRSNLSVPSSYDTTIACLYYDAILNCEPELVSFMKEQSSLLKKNRQFVLECFARLEMIPVTTPKGGLFVALDCSALYGKTFVDPMTNQSFELDPTTVGMAFQSCGLRINTPDWTGHDSIVRVVIAEPYILLKQISSCIDQFLNCYDQQKATTSTTAITATTE